MENELSLKKGNNEHSKIVKKVCHGSKAIYDDCPVRGGV